MHVPQIIRLNPFSINQILRYQVLFTLDKSIKVGKEINFWILGKVMIDTTIWLTFCWIMGIDIKKL